MTLMLPTFMMCSMQYLLNAKTETKDSLAISSCFRGTLLRCWSCLTTLPGFRYHVLENRMLSKYIREMMRRSVHTVIVVFFPHETDRNDKRRLSLLSTAESHLQWSFDSLAINRDAISETWEQEISGGERKQENPKMYQTKRVRERETLHANRRSGVLRGFFLCGQFKFLCSPRKWADRPKKWGATQFSMQWIELM